ncbi:hypothetical protein [Acidiphilium acidophilum]|uniref:hypothetical protein n=1 Tax=Acidiphilium acidophilum TaxID=76588 RepID=UPI002E8E6C9F|nr:hypothetical protein [Acidiphilium acidophilum]MEE3503605.1 hypothetical protein [Acidiphilium acidophilum]
MVDQPPDPGRALTGEILSDPAEDQGVTVALPLTPEGQAALEVAQAFARQAVAPATLRAYKADWTHYADWCAVTIRSEPPAATGRSGS